MINHNQDQRINIYNITVRGHAGDVRKQAKIREHDTYHYKMPDPLPITTPIASTELNFTPILPTDIFKTPIIIDIGEKDVNRVDNTVTKISVLSDELIRQHQSSQKGNNDITRLITDEFSFYQKNTPFSLNEYKKIIDEVAAIAKKLPPNCHMLLSSFPVLWNDGKVHNSYLYVQAPKRESEEPIINHHTKTNRAITDFVYETNSEPGAANYDDPKHSPAIVLKDTPAKETGSINQNYGSLLLTAAGGAQLLLAIEICVDHSFITGKKDIAGLVDKLKAAKIDIPWYVDHIVSSASISTINENMICSGTHADPSDSFLNLYHQATNLDRKSLLGEGDYEVHTHQPKAAGIISDIAIYNLIFEQSSGIARFRNLSNQGQPLLLQILNSNEDIYFISRSVTALLSSNFKEGSPSYIHAQDNDGNTPLHKAVNLDWYELILMPNPYFSPNEKNKLYINLDVAANQIHYKCLSANSYDIHTDIITKEDLQQQKIVLTNNPNLREIYNIKENILSITSKRGHTHSGDFDIIKQILFHAPELVSIKNNAGKTPLDLAKEKKNNNASDMISIQQNLKAMAETRAKDFFNSIISEKEIINKISEQEKLNKVITEINKIRKLEMTNDHAPTMNLYYKKYLTRAYLVFFVSKGLLNGTIQQRQHNINKTFEEYSSQDYLEKIENQYADKLFVSYILKTCQNLQQLIQEAQQDFDNFLAKIPLNPTEREAALEKELSTCNKEQIYKELIQQKLTEQKNTNNNLFFSPNSPNSPNKGNIEPSNPIFQQTQKEEQKSKDKKPTSK